MIIAVAETYLKESRFAIKLLFDSLQHFTHTLKNLIKTLTNENDLLTHVKLFRSKKFRQTKNATALQSL